VGRAKLFALWIGTALVLAATPAFASPAGPSLDRATVRIEGSGGFAAHYISRTSSTVIHVLADGREVISRRSHGRRVSRSFVAGAPIDFPTPAVRPATRRTAAFAPVPETVMVVEVRLGHPVGRPAVSVRRPSHAIGRPGHAIGRPGFSVRRPAHALRRPAHSLGLPTHPVSMPGTAVRRSAPPVRRSAPPVRRPAHPVRRPAHPVRRPGIPVHRSAPPSRLLG